MIPNPENVFEQLQNDVAQKLMETAPFNTIKNPDGSPFAILTEDEGDIQFEFDAMINQLGLAVIVKACTAKPINSDLSGPLHVLAFDVWVSESVTLNRAVGTKIRAMRAAKIIMETLHGFVPSSEQINAPVQYNGFDVERERTYIGDNDTRGVLVVSRICHFLCPLATT